MYRKSFELIKKINILIAYWIIISKKQLTQIFRMRLLAKFYSKRLNFAHQIYAYLNAKDIDTHLSQVMSLSKQLQLLYSMMAFVMKINKSPHQRTIFDYQISLNSFGLTSFKPFPQVSNHWRQVGTNLCICIKYF